MTGESSIEFYNLASLDGKGECQFVKLASEVSPVTKDK